MVAAEPYEVVARRFRPKTFEEIVGQEPILRSLRSALSAERIPHAFLFAGSRGVGKTTLARIFARALNCEKGPTPTPCDKCAACASVLAGTNPDVIEIDAASHNLVEDIRELRERVGFASMGSRYKVYILDEAHMLTRSAFNAFLKTLEEPPPRVVFILATTELHKLPETIRSRCQVLPFSRVEPTAIRGRLADICRHEGIAVGDDVLAAIAAASKGGMRDAETTLERVLPVAAEMGAAFDLDAYYRLVHRVGVDRVVEVVEQLVAGEPAAALRFVAQVIDDGGDEREALGDVLEILRGVLLLQVDGADSELVSVGEGLRARLLALSGKCTVERLDAMIQAGLIGRERLRLLEDRRLVLEVTMLRMAQAGRLPTLGDLLAAVRDGGGSLPAPARAAATATPAPAPVPASPSSLHARLLARLQQLKPLLMHTVEQVELEGPDERGLVRMSLRSEMKMHRDRLASPDVQRLLAEQLSELAGRRLTVTLVPTAAATPPPAPPPASKTARGKVVNRVLEKFDGRIVDEEPPAP